MTIAFREDNAGERGFRLEVRDWLEANLAHELRGWTTRPPFALAMTWYRTLASRGWIAPHWPKEHGGMGASLNEQVIIKEEFARAGAPEISAQGLNHIGPIIMQYGTDAQKKRYLPPILTGDEVWCQGYSEPGSGSDLASLTTRADLDGDHLLVTGQKIWTTWAHHAHRIFALVRTDQNAVRKQAGISFLLIDLKTPGITIRSIRTIAGDDELATVFFDSARVPMANLIGKINDGWRVANSLLAHERLGSGNPQLCMDALDRVKKIAKATGADADAAFRDRLARAELEVTTLTAFFSHAIALVNARDSLGPDSSIMKIYATELLQRLADLLFEAAGAEGAATGRIATPEGPIEVATLMLQCRRATIYGGSNEIQRNILAKRVLNLP